MQDDPTKTAYYATKEQFDELAARVATLEEADGSDAATTDHEHVAPGHNAGSTAIVTGPVSAPIVDEPAAAPG